ncbi:hypothetical protein B0I37DRAFT_350689 [Chaetomium sp. MPI-CAGE-AT-0009]|nr:hypothetical protein B0I37DRAFT_350689 [Chaetomium sp. MPI-CAGE-AT-0009]
MSFATDNPFLVTNIGQMMLTSTVPSSTAAPPLERRATVSLARRMQSLWHGYGLSSNWAWIACHGENVLWLPLEYRILSCAVLGPMVAIGCRSGKVLILVFSSDMFPVPRQEGSDMPDLPRHSRGEGGQAQWAESSPPSRAISAASIGNWSRESNDSIMTQPERRNSAFTFGYQLGSTSGSRSRRPEGGEMVAAEKANITTPLHLAVESCNEPQVRKFLQEATANISAKDEDGRAAVIYAMRDGKWDIALALSRVDYLNNDTYEYKASSLYRAIKRQNKDEMPHWSRTREISALLSAPTSQSH